MGLRQRLHDFFDWVAVDADTGTDDQHGVDTEYLLSDHYGRKYKHMDVIRDDPAPDRVRCNLCGVMFDLADMPLAIEHVAEHDAQGAAEIDPFKKSSHGKTAKSDYSVIEEIELDADSEEVDADSEEVDADSEEVDAD